MKIEKLNLPIRAYNCLKQMGVNTIEELQKLDPEELINNRNIGLKVIQEIKEALLIKEIKNEENQND